jgi:hypothetical protein
MVGKDIYTNCGTVGQTGWPDGVARRRSPRYPMGEQGRWTPEWAPDGGRTGARRRPGVARRRAGSRGVAQRRVSGVAQQGTI